MLIALLAWYFECLISKKQTERSRQENQAFHWSWRIEKSHWLDRYDCALRAKRIRVCRTALARWHELYWRWQQRYFYRRFDGKQRWPDRLLRRFLRE